MANFQLVLEFPPEPKKKLDELCEMTGREPFDAAVAALALYHTIASFEQEGCKIKIQNPQGDLLDLDDASQLGR